MCEKGVRRVCAGCVRGVSRERCVTEGVRL